MKPFLLAAVLTLFAAPVAADIETRRAEGNVSAVMDRLAATVEAAGATIFARVDHAGGAADAGMDLAPSQLLIFGNPALGTPVMQQDPQAGLVLPLRMLAYEDPEGQVWLAWPEVEDMVDDLDVDDDMPPLEKMEDVLERFAAEAARG